MAKQIKTKYLERHIYLEQWQVVRPEDVQTSAKERNQWRIDDGMDKPYVVIIDLSDCLGIPPLSNLRDATKIHPKEYANFVVFGGGGMYRLVAAMVGSTTGYTILPLETMKLEIALEEARELLKKSAIAS